MKPFKLILISASFHIISCISLINCLHLCFHGEDDLAQLQIDTAAHVSSLQGCDALTLVSLHLQGDVRQLDLAFFFNHSQLHWLCWQDFRESLFLLLFFGSDVIPLVHHNVRCLDGLFGCEGLFQSDFHIIVLNHGLNFQWFLLGDIVDIQGLRVEQFGGLVDGFWLAGKHKSFEVLDSTTKVEGIDKVHLERVVVSFTLEDVVTGSPDKLDDGTNQNKPGDDQKWHDNGDCRVLLEDVLPGFGIRRAIFGLLPYSVREVIRVLDDDVPDIKE